MSEAKLPDNVSPALARFADVLCMYNIEVFSAQLRHLLAGPPSHLDERTIMFRLAEHAVHVSAVEMLEARDRKADADSLRSLAPITDQATARAARLRDRHHRRQAKSLHNAALPYSRRATRTTKARPLARLSMRLTPSRRRRAATPIPRPPERSTTRPSNCLRPCMPGLRWREQS